MLVVFGLGLALAFVSGDARFLLLKNSFVTGAVGLMFLATALLRHAADAGGDAELQPGAGSEFRRERTTRIRGSGTATG